MSETVKVMVSVRATIECGGEVEMSREQYEHWCRRIDNAKGSKPEELAYEMFEIAALEWRFGDISEPEIEDFNVAD